MQSTSLRLSKEFLNQARDRLLAFQEEKMEANEDMKPIIIRENVSLEAYIKYCEIAFLIRSWNNQLCNAQEEDLIVGPNSYYTADLTIRPRGLPRPPPGQGSNSEGRPYPTLVVEVGNSESVPSLHDLSTGYFSPRTTIQIYLAIKMFPIRQDAPLYPNTIGFLTNIGVPLVNIVGVGFSATACNASGIPFINCVFLPLNFLMVPLEASLLGQLM
ncbi:3885_t:CDS:2, partial [Paraglomus brasilianum]